MLITAAAGCSRVRELYSLPQQLHLHNRILYLLFSRVYPLFPDAADNEDRSFLGLSLDFWKTRPSSTQMYCTIHIQYPVT